MIMPEFAILIALGMVSAYFAISEVSLFSLGPLRVRRLKKSAPKSYNAAKSLLREPTKLISTILIGNEIATTSIGVVGTSVIYQVFHDRMQPEILPWASVAILLPVLVIFGEIIPKTLGLKHSERVVALIAIPLHFFFKAIRPFRNMLNWVPERILSLTGNQNSSLRVKMDEGVFRSLVDAGLEEGVLNIQEQRLIHNVFNLDDVLVSKLMTPKEKVSTLGKDMNREDTLRLLEKEKYSRFPVLDKDRREVVGVLYAKDLLALNIHHEHEKETIESYIRPALLVSQHATALDLFAQFRVRRTHFGVVVDDRTHEMIGVVSLDNVLEEIFGRIKDERDI